MAIKDWSFLLGPGVLPAINALCFATIMYRSRLVPRWIPTVDLIGAPLLLISSTASLFGVWEQVSSPALLLALHRDLGALRPRLHDRQGLQDPARREGRLHHPPTPRPSSPTPDP